MLLSMPTPTRRPDEGWQELLTRADSKRDAGHVEQALQLSDRAAMQGEDARHRAALFRGDTLLQMGDAGAALSSYESVADPTTADPELDGARGIALFEMVRLPEAELALRSALRGRPDLAEAYYVLGLIAEMTGSGEDTALFRAARRLAPERFPLAPSMARTTFQEIVAEALDGLPATLQKAIRRVPLRVDDMPHPEELRRSQPPVPPSALGMLLQNAETGPSTTIVLFKRNLERAFPERSRLVEEIRRTVLFEVSRALGLRPMGVVGQA